MLLAPRHPARRDKPSRWDKGGPSQNIEMVPVQAKNMMRNILPNDNRAIWQKPSHALNRWPSALFLKEDARKRSAGGRN
jgi:hypothetical protein